MRVEGNSNLQNNSEENLLSKLTNTLNGLSTKPIDSQTFDSLGKLSSEVKSKNPDLSSLFHALANLPQSANFSMPVSSTDNQLMQGILTSLTEAARAPGSDSIQDISPRTVAWSMHNLLDTLHAATTVGPNVEVTMGKDLSAIMSDLTSQMADAPDMVSSLESANAILNQFTQDIYNGAAPEQAYNSCNDAFQRLG
ncbi:MAG: hypothetical protein MRY21_04290 [Simkaniaceae bacterium]|nr:hypothetical protein [Simkaniaceae bacterium]